jgi:hypothetical protein
MPVCAGIKELREAINATCLQLAVCDRLLAAEGLADTQIVSFVMKHAIGRLTPSDIPPQGS